MASIVFSTGYEMEGEIEFLRSCFDNSRKEAAEHGVGHSDGTGFRIGECLKGYNGYREEIAFSLQSWDEFSTELKSFAKDLYKRYGFFGLRAIGLD